MVAIGKYNISMEQIVRISAITGMLVFGTLTVVIQKVVFAMTGDGKNPDETFNKPWFQTETMFVGMAGCLVVYEILMCREKFAKRKNYVNIDETQPLNVNDKPEGSKNAPPKWKSYLLVIAPAMCDLAATAMMNIGLVWIPASVWQMLRGSMVVFTALMSYFFLKRRLYKYHFIGVCVVVVALIVVALSCFFTPCLTYDIAHEDLKSSQSVAVVTTSEEFIGMVLVVLAQVIQASQIVIEEFLLKNVELHAVLIVGLEGLWGGIVCSCICLPIVGFLPASWGSPLHEDTIDTFIMMGKNPDILFTVIAYAFAILGYNMFGMYVTKTTSAVVRTILEACRTACIWVADLFIYYVIQPGEVFGEKWTNWSYLELCGFIFLLIGMFIYNGLLQIHGLEYPPDPWIVRVRDEAKKDDNIISKPDGDEPYMEYM